MPSFDVVSEVDMNEVQNAVNQAQKEISTRFDFKGTQCEIVLEKDRIKLSADDEFRLRQLSEVVIGKLAKRNVSLKNIEQKEPEISPVGHAKRELLIKQGLETDKAKLITTAIRDSKLKVQTQIQDRQVRVTGKSKDDLQEVIQMLRGKDFDVALSFKNFRD